MLFTNYISSITHYHIIQILYIIFRNYIDILCNCNIRINSMQLNNIKYINIYILNIIIIIIVFKEYYFDIN